MVCDVEDPLAPLMELAEVADAMEQARADVDRALWHRALRNNGAAVATEVSLRCAVASAALEGAEYDLDDVRAGTVTDPLVQGALRVATELPTLADKWTAAPRQVLARLHLLAARDLGDEDDLGRPNIDRDGSVRLATLCVLISSKTSLPAALVAAVVHGELLALRPFEHANGIIARAAARLTLASRGLDPRALIAVDTGHARRSPEYTGSSLAFATGTPDGLRSWLKHYGQAITAGAEKTTEICNMVQKGSIPSSGN
ncbi:oxidoreductase [Stackebrandtia soli]|uniref:oxidoreductase n=1 Tax=Stackebrandtia soli TaxID=1892856 RepID=UPI0039E73765